MGLLADIFDRVRDSGEVVKEHLADLCAIVTHDLGYISDELEAMLYDDDADDNDGDEL